jgi:N-acyl homoserine lactone hydrolase
MVRESAGVADVSVRRIDFGYFVRPGEETASGRPQVEPCLGYLVEHPDGLLLVDTGMGSAAGVDEHYRPERIPLPRALRAAGAHVDDVRWVVNCHLHFDHIGGNPGLPGRPVFVQRSELAAARSTEHYTLPELVDWAGVSYAELDGEAEILPGVVIVPTPGHTAGHQSVVVHRRDGTVVVAGQSHDQAIGFTTDALAAKAPHTGVPSPAWMRRLLDFDPARVFFAHDNAVWEP